MPYDEVHPPYDDDQAFEARLANGTTVRAPMLWGHKLLSDIDLIRIQLAAEDVSAVRIIKIPEGVTGFENWESPVFTLFPNLKRVHLPSTFRDFKWKTFSGCKMLETVNIPRGVKFITSYCFYGCIRLRHIVLPEGLVEIQYGAF